MAHWDVKTVDGTVQAVRVGAPEGDPEHTQTLVNLTSRITTAAASDAHATTRIGNVGGLHQAYRDMGAYDDITPGDGETTTFTPAPGCANGTVVATPNANRGLVQDCETLLAAKDALRGAAAVNWGTGAAIGSWEGITTGGAPSRVTGMNLSSKSLTGTIPAGLGRLFAPTTFDLSGNQLTGTIPPELGWLTNLTELRLSGNALTGCIPSALRSVATNDLGALALPYCKPPAAPANLAAGTVTATGVPLTWDAVTGTAKYRVEYRVSTEAVWTVDDDTLTAAAHTVDGLTCATAYEFRVSAFGDGATLAATWGEASTAVTATTGACPLPAPAAPTSLAAGTVTATSVPLTWDAVANTGKYRVEYRVQGTQVWTVDDDTLTGTSHTVDGLSCNTAYDFRVSAHGDGTTLAAAWGAATTPVTATTDACPPTVSFGLALSRVREGASVTVTVRLSVAPSQAVTTPLTVIAGTAAAAEVTGVPASVTIAAGATTASFEVTAVEDQVVENGSETLFLWIGELPAGLAAGQPARHLLLIFDAPSG